MGWGGAAGSACWLCPRSKHALGSHEYIQHCRKFDIDIRLQLMKRKGVRSDLARTVGARVRGQRGGARVVPLLQEHPWEAERWHSISPSAGER